MNRQDFGLRSVRVCKQACPLSCRLTRLQRNHLARWADVGHARPMFVAIVNQKGGVGKTTLAVHLAVWHHERGRKVAFIDADGQSSASRWIRAAEPAIALATETDADGIIERARELRDDFDIVVADGPANLSDNTRAILLVADMAIVPCGVSVPELESTADTIRILKNAQAVRSGGLPWAGIVLNRLRCDRFVLTREARAAACTLGLPVCSRVLRLREPLADAPGQRTVVWRMGRRGRLAADEMAGVIAEVDSHETW